MSTNICLEITFYYTSPITQSVRPEPEPYTRKNATIDTPHKYLWNSVVPQRNSGNGDRACPRNDDQHHEDTKQRVFRK